ncbi:hypothetical protein [Micromonospora sp. WMMD708]|uniref:hypothetical protein n=1 Tax=Micromonospora sp. WMMD708 TaxID=3403464 RepID=UPI003BF522E2
MSVDQSPPATAAGRRSPMGHEHVPSRPHWGCRACGHPWPCDGARSALLAEYAGNRIGLFLYLAGCLHEAIDDLSQPDVSGTSDCEDLFDRFVDWARRRAGSAGATTDASASSKEA